VAAAAEAWWDPSWKKGSWSNICQGRVAAICLVFGVEQAAAVEAGWCTESSYKVRRPAASHFTFNTTASTGRLAAASTPNIQTTLELNGIS